MGFSKIGIIEFEIICQNIQSNRENVNKIIAEIGEIDFENGVGTTFLKPSNKLLKYFWINVKDNEINSFGFGGSLDFSLKDISDIYVFQREVYNRYDDVHNSVFTSKEFPFYTVSVPSGVKQFIDLVLKSDKIVNEIAIHF